MHSHLVILLLVFTITLISAKNIHQVDDNDEQAHLIDDLNRLEKFEEFVKLFQNAQHNQQDYDRYQTIEKRAKAIVKGDPREFMG